MAEPKILKPIYHTHWALHEFPEDVARLVAAFEQEGYHISHNDAAVLYGEWSEEVYCAGWCTLHRPEHMPYLIQNIMEWATAWNRIEVAGGETAAADNTGNGEG